MDRSTHRVAGVRSRNEKGEFTWVNVRVRVGLRVSFG